MNKISKVKSFITVLLLSFFIEVNNTFAQQGLAGSDATAGKIGLFLKGVLDFINNILLPLILGIAFLMFVWGVFKFFILGGSDEEKQSEGKSLMIYAIAGFVLIISFYGIVNVVVNGLGFSNALNTGKVDSGFTLP